MKLRLVLTASTACALFASISLAATLKLKDGRTLVGEVKKLGNSYSILMSDGTRSIVPAAEIVSIDGKAIGDAPTASSDPGAGAAGAASAAKPAAPAGGNAFKLVKSKADRADAPIVAVQLWDDFIQKNPDSPDLAAAKSEREVWDKLYKDNAERVKGKWLGGKELKELKKK